MERNKIIECLFLEEENIQLSTPIYRYLSLESFLFLLEFKRIPFSKIKNWPDSFEGSHFDFMSRQHKENHAKHNVISDFYASCWTLQEEPRVLYSTEREHKNAVEELKQHGSAAMWQSYCQNGGVRIKTTIGKFVDICQEYPSGYTIYHGPVYYAAANSFSKTIKAPDQIYTLLHKRVSFRYESEYRFILITDSEKNHSIETVPTGDLFDFIDEILVSPATETGEWIARTIYHMGLDITIDYPKRTDINSKDGKRFCRISQLFKRISEDVGYH
ncbi:MAG: hypothetical protein K9G39_06840 [Chlorobium sp.]|uniref:DUF2971 domain-containing protein n=1 Tax=Chlorobium sp. TaxID=1095 RepID=UPI0025C70F26|nr:DUF2971 domain-containing protein [Chlorobium sp.]MCF8383300.1 hypothetical protein [Chlorobium sp.]